MEKKHISIDYNWDCVTTVQYCCDSLFIKGLGKYVEHNMFHKTGQKSCWWISFQRNEKRVLDKWIEEDGGSLPSFKSGLNHFQLCLFYRLWASPKSLVNLNVTFMLNQAEPISIQSGEYPSLCCIIMDSGEYPRIIMVTNSQLSTQRSNTEYPISGYIYRLNNGEN